MGPEPGVELLVKVIGDPSQTVSPEVEMMAIGLAKTVMYPDLISVSVVEPLDTVSFTVYTPAVEYVWEGLV